MTRPPFDSEEEMKKAVISLMDQTDQKLTKNEIAKILAVKGSQRVELKRILKDLKNGEYRHKIVRNKVGDRNTRTRSSLKKERVEPSLSSQTKKDQIHIGLFIIRNGKGRFVPCHRKDPFPGVTFDLETFPNLQVDDVVVYHLEAKNHIRIKKVLGSIHDPRIYSSMAIYGYELPHIFSNEALKLANQGQVPALGSRTDFRDLPLVTIDGDNARDFDDAVWATSDTDPRNPHGWRSVVAIADVSYYVRSADALDREAYERGNSVYLPDCVVPMLPEALSNELCSLQPYQDRACLAVEMIISCDGKIRSHRFKRGLMRSQARLTYHQVQKAIQGIFDPTTQVLWPNVLQPLYGVYQSLVKARIKRGTLELDAPERKIIFNQQGFVAEVIPEERFDSHRLIEELMIAANVCAAKSLLAKKTHTLFRIHETPESSRVENLKTVLRSLKLQAPRVKDFRPHHFQTVLSQVDISPYRQLVHDLVLRCQAQARYSPHNIGHFGLSLEHYCHFTSPIRRYADLIVHRALIASLSLGEGGENYPLALLEEIGNHISETERTAALAEREVNDRLTTALLENHLGAVLKGTIAGITGVGIFISLEESGAQGFIPKHRLPSDFYQYDADHHRYIGKRTKKIYQLGQHVLVRVEEANAAICSTIFSLVTEPSPKKTSKSRQKKKDS